MATITGANAIQVASSVTGAMQFVGDFEEILQSLVFIIEADGGSGTYPCPGGGTASAVIDDVPPVDEISAGDSVSLTFNGCSDDIDGDPVILDGSVSFTVTASAGVPGGYDVTVRFVYANLALTMGTETITLNGDITAQASTPDQLIFTTIASGDSLRAAISGPGGSMSARISDMDETRIVDLSLGTFVIRAAGTLYRSDLGGSVDYETTTDFTGTADGPPGAGAMLVTGASPARMRIVALNSTDVLLELDEDGDGTFETAINTTWDELD